MATTTKGTMQQSVWDSESLASIGAGLSCNNPNEANAAI